jgi:hypothetical protein
MGLTDGADDGGFDPCARCGRVQSLIFLTTFSICWGVELGFMMINISLFFLLQLRLRFAQRGGTTRPIIARRPGRV